MARWPKPQGTENAGGKSNPPAPLAEKVETKEAPAVETVDVEQPKPVGAIVVTPPNGGRWRAGMYFAERVAFAADALTVAELEALERDPSFKVIAVEALPPGMALSAPKRATSRPPKPKARISGGFTVKSGDGGQGIG